MAGTSAPLVGGEISSEDRSFFEGSVRPLLVERCYECHSEKAGKTKGGLLLDRRAGWELGGDSGGTVLNLEKPGESLMLRMIHHDPDFEAMPPKSKLADEEISVLEEWVKRGAPDPRDEAIGEAVLGNDFDLEGRSYWWSLQPLAKVSVPVVKDESWPRTDYDRFILAKLEEKEWVPAEDADKATLLRRASITLTGLAPSVEELERFLTDTRGDAYEKEVDRLLASPHFGERFARHWMDVVRYADSKAFEQDYTIPYGNEYRDYLIRAFNKDVPYDQFVREAFAGDLLETPRINPEIGLNESVIGPGFILSTDGQHGPPDIHEDEARIFDGMINTATVAFQALTVSCAKCHDHKFDAITAADYYSFYGMLRSSRLHYANANSLSDQHERAVKELKELKPKVVSAVMNEALANSADLAEVIGAAVKLGEDAELAGLVERCRKDKSKRAGLRSKVLEMASNDRSTVDAPSVADWFQFLWQDDDLLELNGLRRALIGEATKHGHSGIASFKLDERFIWKTQGEGFVQIDEPDFLIDPEYPAIIRGGLSGGVASGLTASRLDGVLRSADFVLDGMPIELWAKGRGATVQLIVRNYELAGPYSKSR